MSMFKMCAAAIVVMGASSLVFAAEKQVEKQEVLASCEPIPTIEGYPDLVAPAQVLRDSAGKLTIRAAQWKGQKPVIAAVGAAGVTETPTEEAKMNLTYLAQHADGLCAAFEEHAGKDGAQYRCTDEYRAEASGLVQLSQDVVKARTWKADSGLGSVGYLFTEYTDKNGKTVLKVYTEYALGMFIMLCK